MQEEATAIANNGETAAVVGLDDSHHSQQQQQPNSVLEKEEKKSNDDIVPVQTEDTSAMAEDEEENNADAATKAEDEEENNADAAAAAEDEEENNADDGIVPVEAEDTATTAEDGEKENDNKDDSTAVVVGLNDSFSAKVPPTQLDTVVKEVEVEEKNKDAAAVVVGLNDSFHMQQETPETVEKEEEDASGADVVVPEEMVATEEDDNDDANLNGVDSEDKNTNVDADSALEEITEQPKSSKSLAISPAASEDDGNASSNTPFVITDHCLSPSVAAAAIMKKQKELRQKHSNSPTPAMEWRQVGTAAGSRDVAQSEEALNKLNSPAEAAFRAYTKQKREARAQEQETLAQYHRRPLSNPKNANKDQLHVHEQAFTFGLIYNASDPKPGRTAADQAAAKIVPRSNGGVTKTGNAVHYDPRYPPAVYSIDVDEEFAQKEKEKKSKNKFYQKQVRYVIKGTVPVVIEKAKKNKKGKKEKKKKAKNGTESSKMPEIPDLGTKNKNNSKVPAPAEAYPRDEAAGDSSEPSISDEAGSPEARSSGEPETKEAASVGSSPGRKQLSSGGCGFFSPHEELQHSRNQRKEEAQQKVRESLQAYKDVESKKQQVRPERKEPKSQPRGSSSNLTRIQTSKDKELEALKQGGLTKTTKDDFSKLEQRSAIDKAAYEAEKHDLEQRRNKAAAATHGKTLASGSCDAASPLDALYAKQKEEKDKARKNEREALLAQQHHKLYAEDHSNSSSHGDALSPMEALYAKQKKEKEEARKKERDILRTYQNYSLYSDDQSHSSSHGDALSPMEALYAKQKKEREEARKKERDILRTNQNYSLYSDDQSHSSSHGDALSPMEALYAKQKREKEEARKKERDILRTNQNYSLFSDDQSHSSSHGDALSPMEALYAKQKREKEEARKKERDTLLAYQNHALYKNGDVSSSRPLDDSSEKSRNKTNEELEALRKLGVTKNTNDEFVKLEQQSALDKAAYEAEKQDLERRKAGLAPQPRPPTVTPDYQSRDNKELEELNILRQQGLAKAGGEQFSEYEKMSAKDRAAYDVAVRDLEERKAHTSAFTFSPSGEMSPKDSLYLENNKSKRDRDKKDKEALGLYDSAPVHTIKDDDPDKKMFDEACTDGYDKTRGSAKVKTGGNEKNAKQDGTSEPMVATTCGCIIC